MLVIWGVKDAAAAVAVTVKRMEGVMLAVRVAVEEVVAVETCQGMA